MRRREPSRVRLLCSSIVQVVLPGAVAWVLGLSGAGASSTDGSDADRVAVLPVQSRTPLPSSTRARLRDAVERGLRRADVALVADERVDVRLGDAACVDAGCAAAVAAGVDAAWVVRPTVEVADTVYEIRLAALDRSGRPFAWAEERCEICGHGEVVDLVVDRSAALGGKVRLLQRRAPRLTVRSRPSGAEVWIDDRLAGHTPLEQELPAGEHRVRVVLPGYASEHRRITATAGTQDTLTVTMLSDPTEPSPRRRSPWWGLGGGALGAGTVMLGAGVGLVMLDEREVRRGCVPDPDGDCPQRWNTLPGGVALALGGGVLLTTGVALLVAARQGADGSRAARRVRIGRGVVLAF